MQKRNHYHGNQACQGHLWPCSININQDINWNTLLCLCSAESGQHLDTLATTVALATDKIFFKCVIGMPLKNDPKLPFCNGWQPQI